MKDLKKKVFSIVIIFIEVNKVETQNMTHRNVNPLVEWSHCLREANVQSYCRVITKVE